MIMLNELNKMIDYYKECRKACILHDTEYTYNFAFLDGSIHALTWLKELTKDQINQK